MYRTSRTEPSFRGQRRVHAALALLLCYACDKLGARKESLVALVGATDSHSLALFTSLGFGIVHTIAVFDQVEMRAVDASLSWPAGHVREYS
jgi:hypothetical protein